MIIYTIITFIYVAVTYNVERNTLKIMHPQKNSIAIINSRIKTHFEKYQLVKY